MISYTPQPRDQTANTPRAEMHVVVEEHDVSPAPMPGQRFADTGVPCIETNTERFARETIGDVTTHYAPSSKVNVIVRINAMRELTFSDYGSLERFYKYGTLPRERIYR